MAALSDHVRRDADHAARCEVAKHIQRYVRRIHELAKTYNQEALDEAARMGRPVDGLALGEASASRALAQYFGIDAPEPHPAIEAKTDPADGFA